MDSFTAECVSSAGTADSIKKQYKGFGFMKKIAVLIPCYNESKTIQKVVADYRTALPEADIYVYDNNSSDGTDVLAREAGAIVRYEHRQGKGNVIRTMFREIHADAYLMIDGDDTYPAEYARQMVDLVLRQGGHGHRRPPFFHLF